MSAALQAWPAVAAFEMRYHLRRPTFWLVAALFALMGAVDVWSNGTQGRAFFFINSPSQVLQTVLWYTLFSVIPATALVAEVFVRDARHQFEPLVLATPVGRAAYVGVRFVVAWLMATAAFSCCLPAMMLATQWPGLSPYAIGPMQWQAYALAWAVFIVPNLFVVSVFSFVLASRWRSLMVAYVGAIVLVMLYVGAMIMVGLDTLDHVGLAVWTWADPFGRFSLEAQTLTWSVQQHNSLTPELWGTVLYNRVLWVGLAALAGWLAYRHFDMRPTALGGHPRRAVRSSSGGTTTKAPRAGRVTALTGLPALVWFEWRGIWRSPAFRVLMLTAAVTLVLAASGSKSFEHSNPSTDILVHAANQYLRYVLTAMVVFFAAELCWRARDAHLDGVMDATPLSAARRVAAVYLALLLLITCTLLLCMGVLATYQLARGHTDLELGLSATLLLGIQGPRFAFIAALALWAQTLTRGRYSGMALTLLVLLMVVPLDAAGLYHNLYRFGATNDLGYSPMNGFGGLLAGHVWFSMYWAAVCLVLLVLAAVWWPLGSDAHGRWASLLRFGTQARQGRLGARTLATTLCVGAASAAALAGWIIYNTTVLNPYQPPGKDLLAVQHERLFKQYEHLPMPVVVSTHLQVDLNPEARAFLAHGRQTLENRSGQAIDQIHLSTFINLELVEARLPNATLVRSWPEQGYHIYRLSQPMMPGEQRELRFTTRNKAPVGFQNHVDSDDVYMIPPNEVLHNGTSLYSPFILPFIGYTKMVEHKEAWLRDRHGLPPLSERMRPHDDPVGRSRAMQVVHLAWGHTEVIASTSSDQQVVSSGRVLRRWQEGGRNHVHYRSDVSDRGKFTLYSARFATSVHRQARVPIEVYRHPAHGANEAAMVRHLASAFKLYEEVFGPYPYGQIRLTEFAYYPGMVYSEGGVIGLPEVLAWKVEPHDPDGQNALVGWLSYLLAHAWWEDQIILADTAGSMAVREAVSAYATGLYRQQTLAPAALQRLRQQQMRDYFRAVGKVDYAEPALIDVYNEVLVARFKGGMVLDFMAAQFGQPAVNRALRQFLDTHRGQNAPYATAAMWRDALLAEVPAVQRALAQELFDKVPSFALACRQARWQPAAAKGGASTLTLTVESARLLGQGLAPAQRQPLGWQLPVALLDERGQVLARQHLHLPQLGDNRLTIPTPADVGPRARTVVLDPDAVFPVADRSAMRCSVTLP